MVIVARGEASNGGWIKRNIVAGWRGHHEKLIEPFEEATSIEAIPDFVDGTLVKTFRVLVFLLISPLLRFAPHQQVIVVCWKCAGDQGDPLPIRRPGSIVDSMQHIREFAGFAAIGVNHP